MPPLAVGPYKSSSLIPFCTAVASTIVLSAVIAATMAYRQMLLMRRGIPFEYWKIIVIASSVKIWPTFWQLRVRGDRGSIKKTDSVNSPVVRVVGFGNIRN